MSNEQPEAILLAEWGEWFLKNVQDPMDFRWVRMGAVCAELRRQHDEIKRLRAELDALRAQEPVARVETVGHLGGCVVVLPHTGKPIAVGDVLYTSPQHPAHKEDAARTTNTTDPIVQTHSAQAEIDRLKKANEGQTRMNVTLVMENAELIRERETLKAKLAACMKALTG